MTPTLRSQRLILASHIHSNLEHLHSWRNDPEIAELSSEIPKLVSMENTRERLSRWSENSRDDEVHFAIYQLDGGAFIGFSHIVFIDDYAKTCRIGIVIGEKKLWGLHYGREAMKCMFDYCFTVLGLNRITCEVFATNPRGWHMLESAGMIREGVLRENVRKGNVFVDEYIYGLLRNDFEGRHSHD